MKLIFSEKRSILYLSWIELDQKIPRSDSERQKSSYGSIMIHDRDPNS